MKSSSISACEGIPVAGTVNHQLDADVHDDPQLQYMPLGVPHLIPQSWADVQVSTFQVLQQAQQVHRHSLPLDATTYAQPRMQPQLQTLTIYMQDLRADPDKPEHLLAEIDIPLQKDATEQWWVGSDDMVRRLQSTPSRIDGNAKLSIKRGIYRQLFGRLSTTSIEKCHPENLKVSGPEHHSIEIIVEPSIIPMPPNARGNSSFNVKRQPESPLDTERSDDSPGPSHRSKRAKGDRTPDSTIDTAVSSPQMPMSALHSAHSSGYPLSATSLFSSVSHPDYLGLAPGHSPLSASSPGASGSNSARTPRIDAPIVREPIPPQNSNHPPIISSETLAADAKAAAARRNMKNERARGAIIPWLKSQIQQEDGWEAFAKSKGRILTIHEALKGYRFARTMIHKYSNAVTPGDLDAGANRRVTKVNVWQALDRQTSWGSDAETTLALVEKYGPGAPEEHPKIVDMLNGKWGPEEREGSVLFLNHLKRIDAEKKAQREAAAAAAIAVVQGAGAALGHPQLTDLIN